MSKMSVVIIYLLWLDAGDWLLESKVIYQRPARIFSSIALLDKSRQKFAKGLNILINTRSFQALHGFIA